MTILNYAPWQLDPTDGYGLWGLSQIKALLRAGHAVRPIPMRQYSQILDSVPAWVHEHMGIDWQRPTIQVGLPTMWDKLPVQSYGLTMWEDDAPPLEWVNLINRHTCALFVPCPYYVEVFTARGVTVPVLVNHGGIDPTEADMLPADNARPYTFLALADRGERKGVEIAFNAFRAAFPRETDVRLILKTVSPALTFGHLRAIEPRLEVISERVPDMREVYRHADCYVYPSYGDGWGLTPRQAVARGIPAIVPRHTGLAVGIDQWATVILEHFTRPKSYYGKGGRWFKPTIDETAAAMRWCYENRSDARAKAHNGRAWLLANQTWAHSAAQLADGMLCYG